MKGIYFNTQAILSSLSLITLDTSNLPNQERLLCLLTLFCKLEKQETENVEKANFL